MFVNATIVAAAVLFMYGTLALHEKDVFLQLADLRSARSDYQTVLLNGYYVFEHLLAAPLVAIGFIGWIVYFLIVLFRILDRRKLRKAQHDDADVGTRPLEIVVLLGAFVCFVASFVALTKINHAIFSAEQSGGDGLLLRLGVGGKAALIFQKYFPDFLYFWGLLLSLTFGVLVWLYTRETKWNKRLLIVVGLPWFLVNMDQFSLATGALWAQFPMPEISVKESEVKGLFVKEQRLFLLGETEDVYVLLAITQPNFARSLLSIKKDQLRAFIVMHHVDVFHSLR
jgi:hypothetical protein